MPNNNYLPPQICSSPTRMSSTVFYTQLLLQVSIGSVSFRILRISQNGKLTISRTSSETVDHHSS
jgi:hypothetical protein